MGMGEQFLRIKYRLKFASKADAETGTAVDKPMNALRVQQAIDQNAASGGTLIDEQVFEASGTWTKPAGTSSVIVEVQGGGGGGGGADPAANGDYVAAGGGAAGGYAREHITTGLGTTETVTIGGNASGGNTSGSGGPTVQYQSGWGQQVF